MNASFSWAQFECSFTWHKMLVILGLLAVLVVPLQSLAEGRLCFVIYEELHCTRREEL